MSQIKVHFGRDKFTTLEAVDYEVDPNDLSLSIRDMDGKIIATFVDWQSVWHVGNEADPPQD